MASLSEIAAWLQAEVLSGEHLLERRVERVHGCDLMSDVLCYSQQDSILLTGLTNEQAVRTAEVAGMSGMVLVRGKRPSPQVVEMARQYQLPLLFTSLSMFDACGVLYARGLRGNSHFPAKEGD